MTTPQPTTAQQQANTNGASPPPQSGWKIYTLSDAYLPRSPVVYLIENILELPSLNMVYGAPSSLKSFILADMSICIATGADWLIPPSVYSPVANPKSNPQKCKPKAVTQSSILWIDFDNGLRRTHERFDMLGKGHSVPDTTPIFYTSMPNPPLMLNNDASVAYLTSMIKVSGAKLVVIDNLGTVTGPKCDENSADMVQVMFNLRKVVEETGVAIIVIHHQRKANGFKTRMGETLRGHSSIEASLDLALLVERDPGSKEIRIQSTKSRGIDVKPFGAIFDHNRDAAGIETARFYGTFIEDTESDDAIKQAILDVVTAGSPGIVQKDIVEEVKGILDNPGTNRVRRLIQTMVIEGTLDTVPVGKNGKFYIIP